MRTRATLTFAVLICDACAALITVLPARADVQLNLPRVGGSALSTTVVNFEDIAVPRGGNSIGGDRTSGGFRFDSSTNHTHMINGFNNADNGSTNLALDDSAGANVLTVSRLDSLPFSLLALDVGEWSGV